MLNQGYGWASNINLRMIFDALFSVESGLGYPPHRQESQQASRRVLEKISGTTHRSMAEILLALPEEILKAALTYPGIMEILAVDTLPDSALKKALSQWR